MPAPFEGTFASLLTWPGPWPPAAPVRMLFASTEHVLLELTAFPDRHLALVVSAKDDTRMATRQFQRLRDIASIPIHVACTWSAVGLAVYINGVPLADFEDNAPDFVIENPFVSSDPLSTEHPDAELRCEGAIQWRRQRFSQPQGLRHNRRTKSDREQMDDLARAASNLRVLCAQIQHGHPNLLGHVVTEIRALIYWYKENPNYNPLLLRMANKASLPLPIYASRALDWPVEMTPPDKDIGAEVPQLARVYRLQELMDIQDWMGLTAVAERSAALPNGIRLLTNADLVAEAASTIGCSHYDEGVSEFLEILDSIGMQVTFLNAYLYQLGVVVASLSEWILFKLELAGIGRG